MALLSLPMAGRAALSALLPRTCALCGAAVSRTARWPLCQACEDAIGGPSGPRCSVCGKPLVSTAGVCTRCRAAEYGFDSAYPLYDYAGAVRDAVIAYKKAERRSLAPFFASRLAEALAERFPGRTVVPVPPRPGKLRAKGWDQVEDLARLLEREHGVTVARALGRSRGAEQKALGLADRRENMKGRIFAAGDIPAPREPVLLDDVMTTGATLSACARALKAAGASRVDALVIAAD